MKKAIKYAAILSGCILTQHCINRACFYIMNKKHPKNRDNASIYQWRFGDVCYNVIGNGEEPLLLIHGIYPGADMTKWNKVDREILKSYKVYAIDLLGFGHSEKPNISYSAYLYIKLINDFIRDVIQKPAITVASDYSAAYTVMGYIFCPELYHKILLISPSGISKGYNMPLLKDYAFKMLLEMPILGTSIYLFLINAMAGKPLLTKLWRKRLIASYIPSDIPPSAYVGGSNAKFPISALFSQYLNVGIKDKLNKIAIPVLILSDEYIGLRNVSLSPEIMDFLMLKRNMR